MDDSPPRAGWRSAGSAWTGGQYSVVRALVGVWLSWRFARLFPWDPLRLEPGPQALAKEAHPLLQHLPNLFDWSASSAFATTVICIGAAAGLSLAIGWLDRFASLLIAYFWICLVARTSVAAAPDGVFEAGAPLVALLVPSFAPRAPFGSWAAIGRTDPDGGWRMPAPLWILAWATLLALTVASAWNRLRTAAWSDGVPLRALGWLALAAECAFLLLAWWRPARPIAWAALLVTRVVLWIAGEGAMTGGDRLRASLAIQLFTFDPGWLPPRLAKAREHVFYDGGCGLCHRLVRFAMAEDRADQLRFSPLAGATIRGLIPESERARLPDSVVVRADDGRVLTRSEAVLHVYARLGGLWRALGWACRAVPRPLRDVGYRFVASIRFAIFGRASEACPLLPPHLRERFLP